MACVGKVSRTSLLARTVRRSDAFVWLLYPGTAHSDQCVSGTRIEGGGGRGTQQVIPEVITPPATDVVRLHPDMRYTALRVAVSKDQAMFQGKARRSVRSADSLRNFNRLTTRGQFSPVTTLLLASGYWYYCCCCRSCRGGGGMPCQDLAPPPRFPPRTELKHAPPRPPARGASA